MTLGELCTVPSYRGDASLALEFNSWRQGEIADDIETVCEAIHVAYATRLDVMLLPQASKPFELPAELAFEGKIASLKCIQDRELPLVVQDIFMKRRGAKQFGNDIQASHGAFASRLQ